MCFRYTTTVCFKLQAGVEPACRNTAIRAESNCFSSSNPAIDGTTIVLLQRELPNGGRKFLSTLERLLPIPRLMRFFDRICNLRNHPRDALL